MTRSGNTLTPSGGYGFRLVSTDPEMAFSGLADVPEGSEEVAVTLRRASSLRSIGRVGKDTIEWAERGRAAVTLHREPASIVLDLPEPLSPSALVHPVLSFPLSLLARWRGCVTLHGGAFWHAGGAWAIVGDRTAGKSSLLAGLGYSADEIEQLMASDTVRGRTPLWP